MIPILILELLALLVALETCNFSARRWPQIVTAIDVELFILGAMIIISCAMLLVL